MNNFKIITLVILLITVKQNFAQDLNKKLHVNFKQAGLHEVCNFIESQTDIHFLYKDSLLQNVQVNLQADTISVANILDQALLTTSYTYVYLPSKVVVIIPKSGFHPNLPDYHPETASIIQEDSDTLSTFRKGRDPNIKKTLVIGRENGFSKNQKVKIQGSIFDEKNKEPLIGATVYLIKEKYGTSADDNGNFELKIKPGKYEVEFNSLGMADLKYILDVRSSGSFKVSMKEEVTALSEVTVNATQKYNIRGTEVGLDKISIVAVKELPSLMGEKDILKISELLPGIVSVGEGSSGVNVRGGNADQNLFYLDNIPIYSTSHLFGFFSSINSAIVRDFSIYKGYLPPQYGGRLSSVFNVNSKNGNAEKFFAQGGISPVSANVSVEGPIIKERLSFLVSGRSTYSNWILKRLPDENLRRSRVNFYDGYASLNFKINDNSSLKAVAYGSQDYFNLNDKNTYDYYNQCFGIQHDHRFNTKLNLTSNLTYSIFGFETTDNTVESLAYKHNHRLDHLEIKQNYRYLLNDKIRLNFGWDAIWYHLDRGEITAANQESRRNYLNLGKEQALKTSVYAAGIINLTDKLDVNAGLRYNYYAYLGPNTVNVYQEGTSLHDTYVVDTLNFGRGELIKSYQSPEIRVGINYNIDNFNSIKLSYSEVNQYMYLLSNTYSINPTDQWKLVDYYSKPMLSRQIALGFYKNLVALGISVSAETYLKKSKNVTEFIDGANFIDTKYTETITAQGDQNAYGIEFMLSKDKGKISGWASYTYSRSFMNFDNEYGFVINEGKKYPSSFDKPHVLNLTCNYKFSRRIKLSTTINYATGRPITLPVSYYFIGDTRYVHYSERNEFRVPYYFRTDLSLTLEGNLRQNKPFHSSWGFHVYNLTGRNNPYSIYFQSVNGRVEGYKYSVIGVPIFTVSWNIKLGNYENN